MQKKISAQRESRLYTAAFTLILIQQFLERMLLSTVGDMNIYQIRYYIRVAALIILIIKVVCYQRVKVVQWVVAGLLVLVAYLTYQASASSYAFWSMILIAAGSNINRRQIEKAVFVVYSSGFVVALVLTAMGVLENLTLTRGDGTLRYALGLKHPNSVGLILFMICLSWCAIMYRKRPIWKVLPVLVAAGISYVVANSRTYTILLCMLAVCVYILYYLKSERLRLLLKLLMAAVGLGLIAASFYFMVYYNETAAWMVKLNTVFSTRLSLANLYYEECSLSLFGTNVSNCTVFYIGTRYSSFMVDNAYCHLIIRYGIVSTILFVVGYVAMYVNYIKNKTWDFWLMGMTLFLILGFSENMTFNIAYNFFLLPIAGILYPGAFERTGVRVPASQVQQAAGKSC